MKIDRTFALLAGFGGSFLAVGLPYWPIPYAMLSLPSSLWNAGLLVVVLLTAACRGLAPVGFVRAWLTIGAAVPSAVMARVVYDGLIDSTSHSLWPIEIIIAAGLGFGASLIGALIGSVVAAMSGRRAIGREGA